MSWKTVRIRALDSLLFRDGRPFAAEPGALTARSLPIPMPSTIAGFLCTLIGERKGLNWEEIAREGVSWEPAVRGPLPMLDEEFVLPAPADALVLPGKAEGDPPRVLQLTPEELRDGEGCDLPEYHCGLRPLVAPTNEKPASGYAFWRWEELQAWLLGNKPDRLTRVPPPEVDRRTHVSIDPRTNTADEGMLYTVEYRTYESLQAREDRLTLSEWSLVAQVQTDSQIAGVGALGGERRMAYVEPYDRWLECPEPLQRALQNARYVRMYLATPAIFTHGWMPGWIRKENGGGTPLLIGAPPGLDGITLRLVAAAVPRRVAVSGWNLRLDCYGPKPLRWCAPAGSVYFFKVVDGDATPLTTEGWLMSVSDRMKQTECPDNSDREAGFGLALWGVWNPTQGGL